MLADLPAQVLAEHHALHANIPAPMAVSGSLSVIARRSRRRTAAATLAFLDQVLDEMPFAIQRLQTDHGAEFFAEDVQRRLMAEAIRFRPIPPRSPHLNGKVERVQRTAGAALARAPSARWC